MIYLDNAATTRVFDSAARVAEDCMLCDYYNPNATYGSAVAVNERIERARRDIANASGATADELIFTSCATESNNRVFDIGIKNRKGNIVISGGEHPSVYECAMALKSRGADVRIAPLNADGCVDTDKLSALIDADTSLVSVIHVSNETGAVNPIKRISEIVKKNAPRALFHSDGVQAFAKLDEPLDGLGVDYYSASAHKIGAPKGIGLLYIRKGINVQPLLRGGGQEHGRRSGTQNTPYIAAFAQAVKEFMSLRDRDYMISLRNELCDILVENGCRIIGSGENSGYIICACIPGVKAEVLQNALFDKGIIIGKGAACSGSKRGNRVLAAMGVIQQDIECCIRLSFFADTSKEQTIAAVKTVIDTARRIRR